MKHAAYEEYKTSGSNWLDTVPSHWNVRPLKLIVKMPITDGPHETPEFIPDGVPFASVEAIWDGKVHLSSVRGYISEDDHRRFAKKYHPKKGDIFIVKSGSTTGKIAIVDFEDDFNVWSPLAAVRCDASQADPAFVFYALSSGYFQRLVQVSWSFGTQPNIGMGVLGSLPVVLPPLIEQQTIARFLDAKTAQIDTLVAKKRQLIDKLKEKRSALITRTVTRGLPPEAAKAAGLEPNPEMKDSGVAWLGEIPAHWLVMPLFRMVQSIQTGPFGTQLHHADYVEDEVPLINPIHLVDGELLPDSRNTVTPETVERLSRYKLLAGDLVFARRGDIGRCGVVRPEQEGWLCGTGSMVVRLKVESCSPLYYASVFRSAGFSSLLELNAVGTTMLNLNPAIVGRMLVPVPPLAEQQAIIDFLDRGTAQLDALTAKVETAIIRLTEYRQALITSAVTGKIDVREAA